MYFCAHRRQRRSRGLPAHQLISAPLQYPLCKDGRKQEAARNAGCNEQGFHKPKQTCDALAQQHIPHRVGNGDAGNGQHDASDENFVQMDTDAHPDEDAAQKPVTMEQTR